MPTSTPLPKDHPLIIAWEAHRKTEEYANSKKWALTNDHVDGSLWALFAAGWNAARAEARSDASVETGGRVLGTPYGDRATAGDLRDPLTPDQPA